VYLYVAKDYTGNIPFSHKISPPESQPSQNASSGKITKLLFSLDGYVLFVGRETGWFMSSVYGHPLSSSEPSEHETASSTQRSERLSSLEGYLTGIRDCCWSLSGLGLMLLAPDTRSLYLLPLARSATTVCYNPVSLSPPSLME